MAQSNTIMAFRKRLKGAGYSSVSIVSTAETSETGQPLYRVTAVEPLAGEKVRRQCSEVEMNHMFR